MRNQIIEKTNTTIMANKNDTLGWSLCSLSSELYWWTAFFNIAFFKTQPVKTPIISFEKKSVKNQGHYMNSRNGFGNHADPAHATHGFKADIKPCD